MSKHAPIPLDTLPDWPTGDPREPLGAGVARAWLWSITGPTAAAEALLSPDERQRADRFYFEPDRNHFVVARAGLRTLLAGALGVAPREVAFHYHALGKPQLASLIGSELRFNLSHSAGVALAVLARGAEVGADIEAVRHSNWAGGIAQRCFSVEEVRELAAQPSDQQDRAFFRFWTNKEAVVKLLGSGLGFPLPSFTTPLDPTDGARVALPEENPLGLSGCWVRSLAVGGKLQASVAAASKIKAMELCRLAL